MPNGRNKEEKKKENLLQKMLIFLICFCFGVITVLNFKQIHRERVNGGGGGYK